MLPWHRPLRIEALNEASADLVGEHDFAPFCKKRDFGTTVRAVQVLRWDRDADGLAVMTVQADAFCHSMVRSLVGVLLPVGDGRRATTWPAEILRSGQKHSAVTVMPAFPLVLEEVGYPRRRPAARAPAADAQRAVARRPSGGRRLTWATSTCST